MSKQSSGIDVLTGFFILGGIVLTLATGEWSHWIGIVPGILMGRHAAESFKNK